MIQYLITTNSSRSHKERHFREHVLVRKTISARLRTGSVDERPTKLGFHSHRVQQFHSPGWKFPCGSGAPRRARRPPTRTDSGLDSDDATVRFPTRRVRQPLFPPPPPSSSNSTVELLRCQPIGILNIPAKIERSVVVSYKIRGT
jgi:hypothetical protein